MSSTEMPDGMPADPFSAWNAPEPTPGFEQVASTPVAQVQQSALQALHASNRTAITAVAVVAGYLLLAQLTGIVLLGIFPVLLAVRSFQRGEPLAPLALVAAAGAVVAAFSVMPH
jgi:hypothetical protein